MAGFISEGTLGACGSSILAAYSEIRFNKKICRGFAAAGRWRVESAHPPRSGSVAELGHRLQVRFG